MAYMPLPSLDVLNKRLSYDPDTGHLYWKPLDPSDFQPSEPSVGRGRQSADSLCKNFNRAHAGKRAGSQKHERGYWYIGIDRKLYAVHRIAWKMAMGEEPLGEIDHINGDPADNRICNLRVVSRRENNSAKAKRRRSAAWRRGVVKSGAKWIGEGMKRINVGGKREDGKWVGGETLSLAEMAAHFEAEDCKDALKKLVTEAWQAREARLKAAVLADRKPRFS